MSGKCTGISLDLVNGGFVVSVASFGDSVDLLQFFTADYQLNTSIVPIHESEEALSNPVTDSTGRIYILRPSSNPFPGGPLVYKLQMFDPHTHQLLFETDWNLKNYKARNGVKQDYPTLAIDPNDDSILVYSRDTPSFRTVSFVDRLPPSSAVGDPQFTGLRGQSFQIHGIDGGIYAIISQPDMQLNSKFVFLKDGKCPTYQTIKQKQNNCWSHPGSYFAEIALKTSNGDHVSIIGGAYNQGFHSVVINGRQMKHNNSLIQGLDSSLELLFIDSFHIKLSVNQWIIEIDNSDEFINLSNVIIKDWYKLIHTIQPHGLLGQTWRSNSNKNQKVTEGKVDDYLIESKDIYGTDFMYNLFTASQ